MRPEVTFLLALTIFAACEKKNIASEYPEEMSALSIPQKGLPYLVGKDLRPVWDTAQTPPPRELLAFHLRDQTGQTIGLEQVKGKVTIVSFFFSRCPGICPMTTKNLRKVQEKFITNDQVTILSFSITPELDTPQVLKKYAQSNKIKSNRWKLLTGSRKEIYQLARDSFSADTFSAKENAISPLSEKDFLHSENVYLLDDQQKLRGIYAGILPSSIEELTNDVQALLK